MWGVTFSWLDQHHLELSLGDDFSKELMQSGLDGNRMC